MLSKLLRATVQRCIYFIHSIKMSPVPHSFALKFTGTLESKTKCIAMFHCALSISKSNVKCPRGHCSAFTFTGTIVLCPGFPLYFIVLNVFRSCYLNRWFCKFRYISVSTIDLLGPGQHSKYTCKYTPPL